RHHRLERPHRVGGHRAEGARYYHVSAGGGIFAPLVLPGRQHPGQGCRQEDATDQQGERVGEAGRTLQRVRHCRLTGGILPQAIASFIPCANGPQAAVWASRVASDSVAAEAVALLRTSLKATVTVHSTRWEERVDQSRKPPKTRTASSVRSPPRLVIAPPNQVDAEEPGAGSRCSAGSTRNCRAHTRGLTNGM